jgi:hypothetical protein
MMTPQFINRVAPSFTLFLDHQMLYKGNGYVNVNSGQLFFTEDPNFPNKKIYASPYRQFVSDQSITGANIPSGTSIGTGVIAKGTSGLNIDYDMGRIIFNNNVSSNISNINLSYAYKEYNIYYNESQDEQLIFDAKYPVRPIDTNGNLAKTPVQYDQITYPAIFVKSQYTENLPFAFGGLDETVMDIRCIFLADSPYLLDAGVSIATDMARKYFPVLYPKDMPFNIYGDYKNGLNYNFKALCSQYCQTGSLMAMIDSVKISRFAPSVNKLIGNDAYGAFADFTIKYVREPRL